MVSLHNVLDLIEFIYMYTNYVSIENHLYFIMFIKDSFIHPHIFPLHENVEKQ